MVKTNTVNFVVNTFIRVIVLAAFFIIGAFSLLNRGKNGYNQSFLDFAGYGAVLGIIITISLIALDLFKNKLRGGSEILTIGHIAEDSKIKFFNNPLLKLGLLVIWGLMIGIVSSSGLQIWNEPQPYSDVQAFSSSGDVLSAIDQFSISKTTFDVAFIPSFTEDIAAYALSIGIVMIQMALLFLVYMFLNKNKLLNPMRLYWITIFVIIGNLISAFYFSNAHEIVAGQNVQFLFAAFVFQFINLCVIWLTYFLPVGHFVHNYGYAVGFATAYSITLLSFWLFARIRKKHNAEVHNDDKQSIRTTC